MTAETLWATPVQGGYKVDNIPFYVRGVAVGDIVEVFPTVGGGLQFAKVVVPSRHSTLRIVLTDSDDVPVLRRILLEKGCETELSHIPTLIAVDVPPSVDLSAIESFLEPGVESGKWEFEEGCIGEIEPS